MTAKIMKWSKYEIEYLLDAYKKTSVKDMAYYLGRSEKAVRIKIARLRLRTGNVKRNLLIRLLQTRFRHVEDFCPSAYFYQETGITPKRFWAIYQGRKAISGKEYAAIADYFNISIKEAIESRQLHLFQDEDRESQNLGFHD